MTSANKPATAGDKPLSPVEMQQYCRQHLNVGYCTPRCLLATIDALKSERDTAKMALDTVISRSKDPLPVVEAYSFLLRERDALVLRIAELERGWRCFHCGEFFTNRELAAEHFESPAFSPYATELKIRELERKITYAKVLCKNVLEGQTWPHSQGDFAQKIYDVLDKAEAQAAFSAEEGK